MLGSHKVELLTSIPALVNQSVLTVFLELARAVDTAALQIRTLAASNRHYYCGIAVCNVSVSNPIRRRDPGRSVGYQ